MLFDAVRGMPCDFGPFAAGATVGTAMEAGLGEPRGFLLGVSERAGGRGGGKGEMDIEDTDAECAW